MQVIPIDSEGDKLIDHPLASIGGKGLFTRNIEDALLSERADIAVHSLKDLPVELTPGLVLAAIPKRGDARDALISTNVQRIMDLPQNATIGTCSTRRAAQMLRLRPDLQVSPLRGNIDTRLRKIVKEQQFDATLLATAGLVRAGLASEAPHFPIDVDEMIPAAAQGALAIQCRADDHVTLRRCLPLNDGPTATAAHAERQVLDALDADCHSAIAVFADNPEPKQLRIRARVLSLDGQTCLESVREDEVSASKALCREVIDDLKSRGALQVLAADR